MSYETGPLLYVGRQTPWYRSRSEVGWGDILSVFHLGRCNGFQSFDLYKPFVVTTDGVLE